MTNRDIDFFWKQIEILKSVASEDEVEIIGTEEFLNELRENGFPLDDFSHSSPPLDAAKYWLVLRRK